MRFYCNVSSDTGKTDATRGGHKRMAVHARGWTTGVRVVLTKAEDGGDVVQVYRTGGSQATQHDELLASWKDNDNRLPAKMKELA